MSPHIVLISKPHKIMQAITKNVRNLATGIRYCASFKKYDHTDGLNFKSLLNEEELMIMDNARQFAQTHLMPRIINDFKGHNDDKAVLRQMGEDGLIGCTLSDYGGSGLSYTSYGLINREIERVDSAYRSTLSVQSSLVIHPIHTFGSQ